MRRRICIGFFGEIFRRYVDDGRIMNRDGRKKPNGHTESKLTIRDRQKPKKNRVFSPIFVLRHVQCRALDFVACTFIAFAVIALFAHYRIIIVETRRCSK